MNKLLTVIVLLILTPTYAAFEYEEALAKTYEFHGTHYIAQFHQCDPGALEDITQLFEVFKHALAESGTTIIETKYHAFSRIAMTACAVLSESHATIHTYPEHKGCFVDLFYCGKSADWKPFHRCMSTYLRPTYTIYKILKRGD